MEFDELRPWIERTNRTHLLKTEDPLRIGSAEWEIEVDGQSAWFENRDYRGLIDELRISTAGEELPWLPPQADHDIELLVILLDDGRKISYNV